MVRGDVWPLTDLSPVERKPMLKRILTTTFILSLLAPVTIHGEASAKPVEVTKEIEALVMPWRFYKRLAKCETDSRWYKSTRRYTSGYGIARGTWMRYSNSTTADRYTPVQQARIVDRIAFLGWTNPKGEYVWPVGPYGFAVIKQQNCMGLQQFICRAKHPKVQRWKRYC
jgi:hypothetical protein